MTLEQVLANARETANMLRQHQRKAQARSIELLCDAVKDAAEDYLVFLSEENAALRSGRSVAWLRERFPQWEHDGHGRLRAGRREYRTLVVPQAANLIAAREAGRAAARSPAS